MLKLRLRDAKQQNASRGPMLVVAVHAEAGFVIVVRVSSFRTKIRRNSAQLTCRWTSNTDSARGCR